VEQVTCEREQSPAVLGVDIADGEVLLEPLRLIRIREGVRIRSHAQLTATQIPCEMHHRRKLRPWEANPTEHVAPCLDHA